MSESNVDINKIMRMRDDAIINRFSNSAMIIYHNYYKTNINRGLNNINQDVKYNIEYAYMVIQEIQRRIENKNKESG